VTYIEVCSFVLKENLLIFCLDDLFPRRDTLCSVLIRIEANELRISNEINRMIEDLRVDLSLSDHIEIGQLEELINSKYPLTS
jgi:alpha-amylase/alpha-mannosidase (GH57 family)